MYIYPYNLHSESVKALADALGARRIKEVGSKFRGSPEKLVINWGNSTDNEEVNKSRVLNLSVDIKNTSDKLKFFKLLESRDLLAWMPPYTTNQGIAQNWADNGNMVVVRHKLQGHSGEGIKIIHNNTVPEAPLYTLYIPKKDEYRVHLFKGKDRNAVVFDVQRKARNTDVPDEEVNWRVRNHGNGFVYVRNDIDPPASVIRAATYAFIASGLDFCAMDVIWNQKRKSAFVLEGNTAPGLTGTTLENYVKMFKENFL